MTGTLTAEGAAAVSGSLGLEIMNDCPLLVGRLSCYSEDSLGTVSSGPTLLGSSFLRNSVFLFQFTLFISFHLFQEASVSGCLQWAYLFQLRALTYPLTVTVLCARYPWGTYQTVCELALAAEHACVAPVRLTKEVPAMQPHWRPSFGRPQTPFDFPRRNHVFLLSALCWAEPSFFCCSVTNP